jgi:hypothetical protein
MSPEKIYYSNLGFTGTNNQLGGINYTISLVALSTLYVGNRKLMLNSSLQIANLSFEED